MRWPSSSSSSVRRRSPCATAGRSVAVAVTLAAAAVYVGFGYAYGPIFLSVVVALVSAVLRGHRRGTWVLAGAGYVALRRGQRGSIRTHDGAVLVPRTRSSPDG